MSPPDLGVDVDVVDELPPAVAPTATDPCFFLHTAADGEELIDASSVDDIRDEFPAESDVLAHAEAFFEEGGARLIFSRLDEDYNDLDIDAALDRLDPEFGPGQIVAPEVNDGAGMATIADYGWANNRVAIHDAVDGASEGNLVALANTVIAATGGRFAELEADTLIIPGAASGQTREIGAGIVKAALMARSDIATGNPNLAAAGVNGQCRYVLGIKAERTKAQRQTLADAQINTFRTVNQRIRAYGYMTLADLDELSHWWDVSGSRTIMAIRAREAAIAEDAMFGQVDAERTFLDRYEGGLRGELAEMQRIGAIYGTAVTPGYSVDVGVATNPIASLQTGAVTARIRVKTSPHARSLSVQITRLRLSQEV